jgi:hypothetical protein
MRQGYTGHVAPLGALSQAWVSAAASLPQWLKAHIWVVWVVGIALILVTSTYLWGGRRVLLVTGSVMLVTAGWMLVFVLDFRPPWQPTGITLEGEPEIGVAYRVKVFTHCGFRNVEFDGDWWASGNPPTGFEIASEFDPFGFDEGTVTLTSPDTAFYTSEFGARRELTRGDGPPPAFQCL